jgi:HlyD family secretion protein
VVARAHIPQTSAAQLKAGDPASVTVPGLNDPFAGRVSLVSPALDPNSTTIEVWVEVANPKGQLKPGSSVQISMVARSLKNALTIPSPALLTAPDGATSVMVAGSDGKAHQKAVKTGILDQDRVQITDGLQSGDKVVASGAFGLPDNSKIVEEKPAGAEPKPGSDEKE